MPVCELCMAYQVLAHFSKRRQLCVHDLFSAEVLFSYQRSMCKQHFQIAYLLFKQACPTNYSQVKYALKHVKVGQVIT